MISLNMEKILKNDLEKITVIEDYITFLLQLQVRIVHACMQKQALVNIFFSKQSGHAYMPACTQ